MHRKHIYLVAIIVFILWACSWFLISYYIDEEEKQGQFGDMFGAVNALFSGGALAGVVIAILLQKEELSLQRDELKATKKELEKAAEAQYGSFMMATAQFSTDAMVAYMNLLQQDIFFLTTRQREYYSDLEKLYENAAVVMRQKVDLEAEKLSTSDPDQLAAFDRLIENCNNLLTKIEKKTSASKKTVEIQNLELTKLISASSEMRQKLLDRIPPELRPTKN